MRDLINNLKDSSGFISIKEERNKCRLELISLIKKYLKHGDIKKVSKEKNIGYKTLRMVLYGEGVSDRALRALYEKAIENRNNANSDYKAMIQKFK
jgi:hypothetical protein